MKKYILYVSATLAILLSCKEKSNQPAAINHSNNKVFTKQDSGKSKTILTEKADEIAKAKNWLIPAIEEYLNKQNGLQENSNEEAEGKTWSIFTPKYEEYKSDAINIDLDGGLSLQQFQEKWKNDFDCKYAGYDSGFLVGAQDWGLIKVTQCDYKTTKNNALIFSVIITDTENKIDYKRDIKVIPSGKSFLISDVLEQD